jgi:hypothetical protein
MLKIIDLSRNEELSSAGMGMVGGQTMYSDDPAADPQNQLCKCVPDAPPTMADLWNKMFGAIAPV